MIRRYGPLLLAPAALLFQIVPGLFIYLVTACAYEEGHGLVEARVWNGSMTGLVFFAVSGLVLASAAAYLLLTRFRGSIAGPMILLFCMPAWLLSSFYLHAVLVFLAWV